MPVLRTGRAGVAQIVIATAAATAATATAVALLRTTVYHPLPYPQPNRLVLLWEGLPRAGMPRMPVAAPDFLDWQHDLRKVHVAAFSYFPVSLRAGQRRVKITAVSVSQGLLGVLGVNPTLGRGFAPPDYDRPATALLSYRIWHTVFGADPNVVGRSVSAGSGGGSVRLTVRGVMPPGFSFPFPFRSPRPALWLPMPAAALNPAAPRTVRGVWAVGRLAPTATLGQARAELDLIAAGIRREHPEEAGETAGLGRLRTASVTGGAGMLLGIIVAAGLAILALLSNVALLAAGAARRRRQELTIRAALGASRPRIVAQVVAENAAPFAVAAALGLAASFWLLPLALATAARLGVHIPYSHDAHMDWAGLAAGLGVTAAALFAATCAAVSQLPSQWAAIWRDGSDGRQRSAWLPALQAAAASLLVAAALVAAGHWLREFAGAAGRGAGSLAVAAVSVPASATPDASTAALIARRLLRSLRDRLGVKRPALAAAFPPWGQVWPFSYVHRGRTRHGYIGFYTAVTPAYFHVIPLPILHGRNFSDSDGPNAPRVAIISESAARQYWPGRADPVGQTIHLANMRNGAFRIVGVAADLVPGSKGVPAFYAPWAQHPFGAPVVLFRTRHRPRQLASVLGVIAASVAHGVRLRSLTTLAHLRDRWLAIPRLGALAMAALSLLALLIAAQGAFAVTAASVDANRRASSIRATLGAPPSAIARNLLGPTLTSSVLGAGAGLALWPAVSGILGILGIHGHAIWIAPLAALIVIAAALAAALPTARRAARADPCEFLREP